MSRLKISFAVLVFFAGIAPASAGDVPATSAVDAVEVYPDGAAVTRSAKADVPAGDSVIVISGLPMNIDRESLRVEATATGGLEIVSADLREVAPRPGGAQTELAKRIKDLRRHLAEVRDRKATAKEQLRFITNIIEAAPRQIFDRKGEQPAPDWTQLLEQFGTSLGVLRETVRASDREAQDITDEIARLEEQQNQSWPENRPTLEARVAVSATTPASAALSLRYATPSAYWRPVYDARLSLGGDKPALELVRRAIVRQTSGEDWSDTQLTLSTAKPGGRAAAPELSPLILRIEPPRTVQKRLRMAPPAAESPVAAAPYADEAEAIAGGVQAQERVARLETRGFDLVYRIPGRVTITGNGTEKTLKVTTDAIEPSLVVRSVPVLDPTAYLAVRFGNKTGGPILPGTVQLFRDGVFVGKSRVGFTAPDEEIEFGFGEDPAVVVERVTLERSKGERGVLSTDKIDQRRFKIIVTNRHDRDMTIEIEDRLPYSENEKIEVEVMGSTTKPSMKDPDGRRGVMLWSNRYTPGQKREIQFGYSVRWPEGERVIWSDRRRR